MAVRVQVADFDLGAELSALRAGRDDIGAMVSFSGLVRADDDLQALELEHYPAMTQTALEQIEAEAITRWSLSASLIIHRVGRLLPGAQIMMVATASKHRADAFQAAEFLMDFLKSRAPFWKKEHFAHSTSWVAAKHSDEAALGRWDTNE